MSQVVSYHSYYPHELRAEYNKKYKKMYIKIEANRGAGEYACHCKRDDCGFCVCTQKYQIKKHICHSIG